MPIPTHWKIAGATAAATGLALGGFLGLAQDDPGGSADRIDLQEPRPAATSVEPVAATSGADAPGDSVASPLDSPATPTSPASPASVPSVDSPAPAPLPRATTPAPAPAPDPAPAPRPAPVSVDSPDSPASVDSPDSVDSP